nr:SIR2 family protein [Parvularcula dongshanensis]
MPDAEHYAIAVLVKEGLVRELPSANWDGLIEKATRELSGDNDGLKICVRSEDLQAPDQKATLTKFHGCAVRARDDEALYRPYLVGAQRQIDGWATDAKVAGLVQHLIDVAISKPTLLLGFSAQDANIRTIFALAADKQSWDWPGDLPAYVMAEEAVGEAQTALLANVYRNQFAGADRAQIKTSAHLQAYAKPLLTALLLWTYAAKLQRTARLGTFDLSDELAAWVDEGVILLRDQMAAANTGNHLAFVEALIGGLSRGKRLFLAGRSDPTTTRYEALSPIPLSQMDQNVETETDGTPEAAVIAATLAKGVHVGDWTLRPTLNTDDRAGVAELTSGGRTNRVFMVGKPDAELALHDSEAVLEDDEDAILIHARSIHERMQRSPTRAPGRTGGPVGPRRVSMASLIAEVAEPSALMERFKQEAGL